MGRALALSSLEVSSRMGKILSGIQWQNGQRSPLPLDTLPLPATYISTMTGYENEAEGDKT